MTVGTLGRALAIAALAALLLALAGGFGSSQIPLLPRFAYWFFIMVSASLCGIGALAGSRAWGRLERRSWSEGLLVSAGSAIPTSMIILGMEATFLGAKPTIPVAVSVFLIVFVVAAVVTAVNYMAEASARGPGKGDDSAPVQEQVPVSDAVRLIERLPPHLRQAQIQVLQSEDHYLRVHTDSGAALILMRFSDALEEVKPLEGLQTHRSWWVARSAIGTVDRSEGRPTLMLNNGLVVPVSRTYAKELRKKGWFDQ